MLLCGLLMMKCLDGFKWKMVLVFKYFFGIIFLMISFMRFSAIFSFVTFSMCWVEIKMVCMCFGIMVLFLFLYLMVICVLLFGSIYGYVLFLWTTVRR